MNPKILLPVLASLGGITHAAAQVSPDPALETVTVTAQRLRDQLESERLLVPGGVSIIDGESLQERKVANLSDMLRYTPGVWTDSPAGGDDVFLSSRGSNLDATDYDRNGIKLLQDGLPVTTADGNNHNRLIDPLSTRYAVVARGANALTYGASTLGGAIDFLSPTARDSDPISLFANGGSHGLLNGRLSAGGVSGAVDGLVTAEAKQWDGYREHSAMERQSVFANLGWQHSEAGATRFYGMWSHYDTQLPGALTREQVDADPDQASAPALGGDYGKEVDTWRIAAKTSWKVGANGALEAGVSYEEQSLFHPIVDRILVDFDGPGPMPPMEVFSLLIDTDHRDTGAMARYRVQAGDHNVIAGANYGVGSVRGGNYRNAGGQANGLLEHVDNEADSLELFVMDRWNLGERWTLVYGAQYVQAMRDVRTTNAESGIERVTKDDYDSVNPRLGVIYTLAGGSEAYASVSRLFEAPTTFEMEDDVRGNGETLDAMHGTVVEAGLRSTHALGASAQWHWDVSAYYAGIRDEILSVDDPEAPGNSLTTNIDRTIHAGLEALVGASLTIGSGPGHRLEPLLSATVNDFRFDSDPVHGDNRLPGAPRYALRGELLYRSDAGYYVGPTFDLIGSRYADFANSYEVGSYGLLGLRAGYDAAKWQVFAELTNLSDKDYIATLSVLDRAQPDSAVLYPGAPRSAYAGFRLSF